MVKNPPCNAGDVGLIPGWGAEMPHFLEQLSPSVTTTEPLELWSPQVTIRESVGHNESSHRM